MSRVLVPLILLAAVLGAAILVADHVTRPQDVGVAVIGDSITAIGQQQLKISAGNSYVMDVRAEFGVTIANQMPAATELAAAKPEQVIINLGTNDALQRTPIDQSMASLQQMVDLFPDAKCIHFVMLNPFLDQNGNAPKKEIDALNRRIERLAAKLDRGALIRWDEMMRTAVKLQTPRGLTDDGVHPGPKGQRLLGDAEVHALERCGRPWHYW